MIALTLSMTLLLILSQFYFFIKKNFLEQTALMEMGDKVVDIFDMMEADLRQIRKIGCAKLAADFPLAHHGHTIFAYQHQLMGEETAFTVSYPVYPPNTLLSASHEYMLNTDNEAKLKINDVVLLADCKHAEILTISHIDKEHNKQRVMVNEHLDYFYQKNAELSRMVTHRYFFKKIHHSNYFTLLIEDEKKQVNRIMENIKFFSLHYFIKNQDELQLHSAENITDWTKVIGLKIKLIVTVHPVEKTWYRIFGFQQ